MSQSTEDYLKAIYEQVHERDLPFATTGALALALGVTPASVTAMLKKLAGEEPPLLDYEPYQGARLTGAGQRLALEVVRHHRLLETFLSETLGYSWDEVHEEAHRLEHAISEELEERMAVFLGRPLRDPHGSPIPDRDGGVALTEAVCLSELPLHQPARVERVSDRDPALLRYLAEIGLTLGAPLEVKGRDPFDGPQHIRLLDTEVEHALGKGVTDHVFVAVAGNATPGRDEKLRTKRAHSDVAEHSQHQTSIERHDGEPS